jgi:peptidoglycan/xylan/chitin deacetylase (PgdA/CDA1 family)
MKRLLTIGAGILFTLNVLAQNPSTSIATWKNDAKGAYSFIHDDYGDNAVLGINNYADTIARNRGIKFTIGAITASCEGNPKMWTDAIDMINYGHEIINHTHNHYCAVRRDAWCTTGLWAEPSTEDFATEMTHSTQLITSKTGTTPRFFIYPYDLFNDAANAHLKSLNYIGSRTGTYDGDNTSNFAPDAQGFFKTAFYVKTLDNNGDIQAIDLNKWADHASTNNVWVNREMHNVGPTGWGRITVANYRDHLNHLQTEVAANNLWVGTISEVLTYQIQKLNYNPSTAYNSTTKTITISWNTPSFDVASYLAPLTKKSPVTMLVNLDGIDQAGLIVTQGSKAISGVSISNGIMKFDAYPSEGTIKIASNACSDFCLVTGLSPVVNNAGANVSFSIDITASPTVTYKWYFNDVLINGESSSNLTLNNIQSNQTGTYKVIATKGSNTPIESSSTLNVQNQTPYNNSMANIPGKVEFENFDVGGEGISYHESTTTNQGDAFIRTEPVDLEVRSGGYNLGYTFTGEWLEYTVNITTDAIYDIDINHATAWGYNGEITLSIDGNDVANNLRLPSTGGWSTWKETTFSDVTLFKGVHILKVHFDEGYVNVDYINFKVNAITGTDTGEAPKSNVAVFPNPTSTAFTINSGNNVLTNLSVSNIEGKKVITKPQLIGTAVIGENLNSGVYILEYTIDDQTIREKIVKR